MRKLAAKTTNIVHYNARNEGRKEGSQTINKTGKKNLEPAHMQF
jgi:hypothetical protein